MGTSELAVMSMLVGVLNVVGDVKVTHLVTTQYIANVFQRMKRPYMVKSNGLGEGKVLTGIAKYRRTRFDTLN